MSLELHLAAPIDLDADALYRILQLRVEVFVVEQQCPFLELDGRDLEPGARWLWATEGSAVVATLRMLRESRATVRIGRVATARHARSSGVATALMRHALDVLDAEAATAVAAASEAEAATAVAAAAEAAAAALPAGIEPAGIEVVLDAQSPLAGWYQRFGFEPAGAEYVEDGINHLPMRRPARLPAQT